MSDAMHEINDRLSDYLDGELAPDERRRVEAHLRECGVCRADLDALRAVTARAAALVDAPPRGDLWPGISARVGGVPQQATARAPRRLSFTVPQLVAAGLALMVLSGGVVWLAPLGGARTDLPAVGASTTPAGGTPSAVSGDPAYDEAADALRRTFQAASGSLDAETVRTIQDSMELLDAAVRECRAASAAHPRDPALTNCLGRTGATRLEFLTRVATLAQANR